jgi:hypothetical protein
MCSCVCTRNWCVFGCIHSCFVDNINLILWMKIRTLYEYVHTWHINLCKPMWTPCLRLAYMLADTRAHIQICTSQAGTHTNPSMKEARTQPHTCMQTNRHTHRQPYAKIKQICMHNARFLCTQTLAHAHHHAWTCANMHTCGTRRYYGCIMCIQVGIILYDQRALY